MKRLKLNILSPKGDNAMSGQKRPRKKAPTRTLWIAPALGVASAAVLLILFSTPDPSHGQTVSTTTVQTVPDWVGKLTLGALDVATLIPPNDPVLTDPGASDPSTGDPPPPHLSNGTNWALFGTAKRDLDPQNHFNQVISFDTHDPNAIAGAVRKFGPRTQVGMLTDQVELKYLYVGRTCGGGSTRLQLGIDGDGDGKFNQVPGGPDQNAFGYLGDKPFGGFCVMNQWVFEDMTDNVPKWDLSQWTAHGAGAFCTGANAMTCTWSQMVMFFNTVFPQHQVLNAVLVDDSQSFFTVDSGCAFFDQVAVGKDTLDEWNDTSSPGNQTANNCSN